MKKNWFRLPLILLLVFFVTACGGRAARPEKSAEQHFQTAENQMERGLWTDAITSWEQVRDAYHTPELSMLAELKLAETYYLAEQYPEAAMAYSEFLQRYPNDPRTPTILFRLGQSHYQQILTRDRDQSSTRDALYAFEQLVTRFPQDHLVQQANQYILRCSTRLADHEVYVGRFYFERGHHQPAIQRLETVLQQYPDYYYRDEAFFFLGRAYLATDRTEEAQELFRQLMEQFPASSFYSKTEKLLTRNS